MDVAFFNSLNSHYDSQVVAWLGKHPGRSVSEDQIGGLFAAAYGKAASVSRLMPAKSSKKQEYTRFETTCPQKKIPQVLLYNLVIENAK